MASVLRTANRGSRFFFSESKFQRNKAYARPANRCHSRAGMRATSFSQLHSALGENHELRLLLFTCSLLSQRVLARHTGCVYGIHNFSELCSIVAI
jgi:hypothetical protein